MSAAHQRQKRHTDTTKTFAEEAELGGADEETTETSLHVTPHLVLLAKSRALC